VSTCEELYTKIHEEIRKNPSFEKKPPKVNPNREHVKLRKQKMSLEER
jgi:hypothetical protein